MREVDIGPVRYAAVDGCSLAFQSFGSGAVDILAIPPMAQNIELTWERPEFRHMFDRFGSFARVVHYDKRGTGASDRTTPVPNLDQHVDDARAVMDAAGIERAVLHGVSEGGPLAILFAATYPERVAALILHETTAVVMPNDLPPDEQELRRQFTDDWLDRWGTDETITLSLLAPTADADDGYRRWEPRYERQSATPAAMRDLIGMFEAIDVRELLPFVRVPTLVLHRKDDRVISVERARELAAAIPGARLVEHDGADHFPHIGDVDAWLDEVERFVTGRTPAHLPSTVNDEARAPRSVEVRAFGGFTVLRDGDEVPIAEWGSRRARTLLKRLAADAGRPVPRDQLVDVLWPDEADHPRSGARLSVQLSAVRRVLGGGVVADRDAVRLDTSRVSVDVARFETAVREGRDVDAVDAYTGEFLPEDVYSSWAAPTRDHTRAAYIAALRRLAAGSNALDRQLDLLRMILEADRFDDDAHRSIIRALHDAGRIGDARRAHDRYSARLRELTIEPAPYDVIVG